MSRSPFAAFTNALLRFQVASGALETDANGNLRPGVAVIEVEAMLKQKNDANFNRGLARETLPGVDSVSIFLQGKITNVVGATAGQELTLPSVITPDSPCAATWNGINGQFLLEYTAPKPILSALKIDLVNQIRGYFLPGSFVVEGEPWQPSPTPAPETTTGQYSDPIAASASLSALRVVIVNESGLLAYADSATPAHAFRVVGLLASAVSSGESVAVLIDGLIADSGWNWTIGSPIFIGANGVLTQTPPESGFLQQVATPITATQIDFELQEPILL